MSFIFAQCTCVCRHLIVQQSVIYYLLIWMEGFKENLLHDFQRSLGLGTTKKIKLEIPSECPRYYRILSVAHILYLFLDIYSHFPIKHQWDISQSLDDGTHLDRICICKKRVLPVRIDRWSSADITTATLLLYVQKLCCECESRLSGKYN